MPTDHPRSFGMLLKKYRKEAHLTQFELADRARLSMKAISALECDIRHPRRVTIELLADALNLSEEERRIFEAVGRGQEEAFSSTPEQTMTASAQIRSYHISHDWLVVGGRIIRWIVLGRARYASDTIHCAYDEAPIPLVADFARMLSEYQRDREKRQQSGEVGLPYNSGMYKLKHFHVGSRQIIDGEEVPELLLEFGPTDYFTQIITDFNTEHPIRRRFAQATDITEKPVSEFSSIVGVNLSFITSDQTLIVTRRSSQAFVAGGSLHTSVAENLLRPKDATVDGAPNPFSAASRGALEEIGIDLPPDGITFGTFGVDPHLCQYSLLGTVFLQKTSGDIEDLWRKGIPKDKWESRQLLFVPFTLQDVAQFVSDSWESWFSIGLAAVVMSLLDAGYSGEDIDGAFAKGNK